MDLNPTESERLLVEAARHFFEREFPLDRVRSLYLVSEKLDRTLWTEICEMGWNSVSMPEEIGGFEGGLVASMLLLQEMGRAACVTPFPHSSVACALALLRGQQDLSKQIAESRAVVIPVMRSQWTLSGQGETLRVFGNAGPIVWADLATHLVFWHEDSAYLMHTQAETVAIEPVVTSRGEFFSSVACDGAQAIRIDQGSALRRDVTDYGAFACAALLLGIAERALELAVAYAKEREQFGRPIGSFQAIQHKTADMRIAVDAGRVLIMRASAERDPAMFSQAVARAKAWMGDTARKVTRDTMQIFGGVSFCGDHISQLLYQFVISLANHYGASHEHRARLASNLLD